MPVSLYQASVPGYIRQLNGLPAIIRKAIGYCAERKIDPVFKGLNYGREVSIDRNLQNGEQKKPLRFEDLIVPNPYLKPWMLPYLPSNVYVRDGIIGSVGLALGGSLGVGLMLLFGDLGVVAGLAVGVIALWLFPGEVRGRYLSASVKFWQQKKNGRTSES